MVCLIQGQFGWKEVGRKMAGHPITREGQGKRVGKILEYILLRFAKYMPKIFRNAAERGS